MGRWLHIRRDGWLYLDAYWLYLFLCGWLTYVGPRGGSLYLDVDVCVCGGWVGGCTYVWAGGCTYVWALIVCFNNVLMFFKTTAILSMYCFDKLCFALI